MLEIAVAHNLFTLLIAFMKGGEKSEDCNNYS